MSERRRVEEQKAAAAAAAAGAETGAGAEAREAEVAGEPEVGAEVACPFVGEKKEVGVDVRDGRGQGVRGRDGAKHFELKPSGARGRTPAGLSAR